MDLLALYTYLSSLRGNIFAIDDAVEPADETVANNPVAAAVETVANNPVAAVIETVSAACGVPLANMDAA
jgi:hypothetical protein